MYYVAWLCFGKVMACHGKLWRWIPFLQSVGYRRGASWKHLIVVPLSSVRGRCHYIQSQSSYRRFWRRWWWYKHVDASLVSSCMRQLCFCLRRRQTRFRCPSTSSTKGSSDCVWFWFRFCCTREQLPSLHCLESRGFMLPDEMLCNLQSPGNWEPELTGWKRALGGSLAVIQAAALRTFLTLLKAFSPAFMALTLAALPKSVLFLFMFRSHSSPDLWALFCISAWG